MAVGVVTVGVMDAALVAVVVAAVVATRASLLQTHVSGVHARAILAAIARNPTVPLCAFAVIPLLL